MLFLFEKEQLLGPVLRYLGRISFSIGKPFEKIFSKSLLSKTDDDVKLWTTEKSDTSSAKSLAFVLKPFGKLLVYTKKNKAF